MLTNAMNATQAILTRSLAVRDQNLHSIHVAHMQCPGCNTLLPQSQDYLYPRSTTPVFSFLVIILYYHSMSLCFPTQNPSASLVVPKHSGKKKECSKVSMISPYRPVLRPMLRLQSSLTRPCHFYPTYYVVYGPRSPSVMTLHVDLFVHFDLSVPLSRILVYMSLLIVSHFSQVPYKILRPIQGWPPPTSFNQACPT